MHWSGTAPSYLVALNNKSNYLTTNEEIERKRKIHLKRREGGQVAIEGGSGRPDIGDGSGVLVRPREEPLVGLNVQEQYQIIDVDADGIGFVELCSDKRFGVGVQNRGERIDDESGMLNGDLQCLGDGRRVDSLVGG